MEWKLHTHTYIYGVQMNVLLAVKLHNLNRFNEANLYIMTVFEMFGCGITSASNG